MRLELPNPDAAAGGNVELQLLRSPEWLEKNAVVEGAEIAIFIEEMGIAGTARVLEIGPCPDIADGAGRVILGTLTSLNATVLQITFKGRNSRANHP